jgi:hypothetical protein
MTPKVRIFRALLPAGFLAVPALAIPVQAQVTKRGGPTASRVAVASRATGSRSRWSIQPTPNPGPLRAAAAACSGAISASWRRLQNSPAMARNARIHPC